MESREDTASSRDAREGAVSLVIYTPVVAVPGFSQYACGCQATLVLPELTPLIRYCETHAKATPNA